VKGAGGRASGGVQLQRELELCASVRRILTVTLCSDGDRVSVIAVTIACEWIANAIERRTSSSEGVGSAHSGRFAALAAEANQGNPG